MVNQTAKEVVLELTEEQRRQIEQATGKSVTELQVEVVEVTEIKPAKEHSHEGDQVDDN